MQTYRFSFLVSPGKEKSADVPTQSELTSRGQRVRARSRPLSSRYGLHPPFRDSSIALRLARITISWCIPEGPSDTISIKVRDRLEALCQISHHLDLISLNWEDGVTWLATPVPLLQGRRPIDFIRKGEHDEVLAVLAGLYPIALV
jgi:hypothetical protein